VRPSALDPVFMLESELALMRLAARSGFTPLTLSPLAPFGSCSITGFTDQNKVVTALRGTEVVADATNVLALEAALKRRANDFDNNPIHYCAAHRHVRAQSFTEGKGFTAHFQVFCAVSAGRDQGNFLFEKQTLLKHLDLHTRFLLYEKIGEVTVTVKALTQEGGSNPMATAIFDFLPSAFRREGVTLKFIEVPLSDHRYYRDLRFSIDVDRNKSILNIGDGGFVDWPEKLTGNKKERMLTSGLGTELLWKAVNPMNIGV
jgi:hypothetical protein